MSSMRSAASEWMTAAPDWFADLLGMALPANGETVAVGGQRLLMRGGILRAEATLSPAQAQTEQSFAYIWSGGDRFRSEASLGALRDWYRTMYGDIAGAPWWADYGDRPLLVDAGCGAGLSAMGLFGERLKRVRYLGI